MRITKEDIEKTAFRFLYVHSVMPFGLTNTPATFMDLMQRYFKEHQDSFVIVFIDDILIYLKNKKEHETHLNQALRILKEKQTYGKLRKCDLDGTSYVLRTRGFQRRNFGVSYQNKSNYTMRDTKNNK